MSKKALEDSQTIVRETHFRNEKLDNEQQAEAETSIHGHSSPACDSSIQGASKSGSSRSRSHDESTRGASTLDWRSGSCEPRWVLSFRLQHLQFLTITLIVNKCRIVSSNDVVGTQASSIFQSMVLTKDEIALLILILVLFVFFLNRSFLQWRRCLEWGDTYVYKTNFLIYQRGIVPSWSKQQQQQKNHFEFLVWMQQSSTTRDIKDTNRGCNTSLPSFKPEPLHSFQTFEDYDPIRRKLSVW